MSGQPSLGASLRYPSEPDRFDFAAEMDCPHLLQENWARSQRRLLASTLGNQPTTFESPEELQQLNTCLGGHGSGWDTTAGALTPAGGELFGSLSSSGTSSGSLPLGTLMIPGGLFRAGSAATGTGEEPSESPQLTAAQEVPLESDLAGGVVLGLIGYGCYRRRRPPWD